MKSINTMGQIENKRIHQGKRTSKEVTIEERS